MMNRLENALTGLIEQGPPLIRSATAVLGGFPPSVQAVNQYIQDSARWVRSGLDALTYAGLEEHREELDEAIDSEIPTGAEIARATGILQSALDAIRNGFVEDLRGLLRAEMFDSFADQAEELLKRGHSMPAAMVARRDRELAEGPVQEGGNRRGRYEKGQPAE